MKDNFSSGSKNYARYRPTYPSELFEWINSIVNKKENAWDCGTGNGQIAFELVKYFEEVYATDISEQQLKEASKHSRIHYSKQPAEKTNFPDQYFDLIIVGQAIHWFNFNEFYLEVSRTLKPGGIFIMTGYGKLNISAEIDPVINDIYFNKVGKYWDKERKYIDENYTTIPFPFKEIKAPEFENKFSWHFEHLIGYLKTWSAVKHFMKAESYDPIEEYIPLLKKAWENTGNDEVSFPLLLRAGYK